MSNTTTRTDIHRPSAPSFDPEAYDFTGAVFDAVPDFPHVNNAAQSTLNHLLAEGFVFSGVHGGRTQCDHCGAHLRYSALMVHRPTMSLIYVGETCLGNRFADLTRVEFRRLQASAKLARELALTKAAFEIACDEHPALAYATYFSNIEAAAPEGTFSDFQAEMLLKIARQARQYGSLAAWHVARVETLIGELEATLARKLAWIAEDETRQATQSPAPQGRVAVEGTVTKYDERVNDFGVRYVMTVELADGARVWGTVPATIIADVEVGTRVAFTATFERSAEDESFAFFKRPTKARVA